MAPLVFISYLRATGAGWAGRLFDVLTTRFSEDEIFFDRDVNDIPIGPDYWLHIRRALNTSQIVLAVIDPNWVDWMKKFMDRHRLFHKSRPLPCMCEELSAAFRLPRMVLPLLIGLNSMPPVDALPEEIRPLLKCQVHEIYPAYWRTSADELIAKIEHLVRMADSAEARFKETRGLFPDVQEGRLSLDEQAYVNALDPKDRARYLIQRRMEEKAELAPPHVSQVELQRHRDETMRWIAQNIARRGKE